MAQTIQIRRGTGSAVPSSLAAGELAINLDSGKLFYGKTSTSASSDFRVDSITAENYIVSSSVTSITTQTLSGSTAFGDDSADIHNRTGSLNVSGSVTVDGTLTATDLIINDDLTLTDDVNINATGRIYLDGAGGDQYIVSPVTGILELEASKKVFIDTDLQVTSNITASGNISASGTILGGPIIGRDYVEFGNTSGNRIEPVNSTQYDLKIGNVSKVNVYSTLVRTTTPFQVGVDSGDYLKVLGNITASGDISASGNLIGNEAHISTIQSHDSNYGVLELKGDGVGSGLKIHSTHDTGNRVVGLEMSSSGTGQVFSMALKRANESFVISPTTLANSATSVFELSAAGNITASGDISSSGIIRANRFQSNGITVAVDNGTQTDYGHSGRKTFIDGTNIKLDGPVTASGDISSSGTITANTLRINDELHFSEDENFTLNNHGANGFSVFSASAQLTNIDLGGTRQKFLIPVEVDGNISSSGFVSASSLAVSGDTSLYGNLILSHSAFIYAGAPGSTYIKADDDNAFEVKANGTLGITIKNFGVVINEDGSQYCDFRVEGDSNDNVLRIDASEDKMYIGANSAIGTAILSVHGDVASTDVTASGNIKAAGNISATNISASGYISSSFVVAPTGSFETLKGIGSTTGLEVSGYVSASTEVLGSTGSFNVMTKAMAIETFGYAISANHTSELYVPLAGTTSDNNFDSYLNRFAAPYNGTVKRISLMYQISSDANSHPGEGHIVRVRAADDLDIDDSDDIVETVTRGSISQSVMHHFDFSASFNKGQVLGFTVQAPNLPVLTTLVFGTIAFEFDTST